MGKLRYGIIGAGGCGKGKHLSSYSLLADQVEIVAVCDIIAAKANAAADQFGAEAAYTDYNEMLAAEKLDLVSVATPNFVHAPAAIAALEAGAHVHCEKPASMTPELVQSMVDAKNRTGKKLMIGLNNRFTPWAQFAKQWVVAGNLGEIYHAKCGWKRRRGIPGKGGWFTTKSQSGGGPLIDLGVHFLDVCNYLLDFPQPATCSGSTYSKFADCGTSNMGTNKFATPDSTYDVEDLAVGFVRYAGGLSLELEFSWASNTAQEYTFIELYGTKGGLKYEKGQLTLFEDFEGTIIDATPKLKNDGAWGNTETRHLVDCILNDREVLSKPEEAVKIMQIIQGIYQSAETGNEVRVG